MSPRLSFLGRHRLRTAWRHQPYSLTLAVVLIPVGIGAILLGDDVSQALSNITANHVSRVMGIFFLLGGVCTLLGILRRGACLEAAGLTMMAAGMGIYGLGVMLGLGVAGMVAGPGYCAAAVATARRVHILLGLAARATPHG